MREANPLLELKRFQDYTREDVHTIFSPNTSFTPQAGTWGLQGIVAINERPNDYVFFVTFGKKQGDHIFEEGVTADGVLTWQSQPRQSLKTVTIKKFINHDELKNSIFLFLRTNKNSEYTYLGKLKYLSHDTERENPVHFQWQILDWDNDQKKLARIGMKLQPSSIPEIQTKELPSGALIETLKPKSYKRKGSKTNTFRAQKSPDYSAKDAKNRKLGLQGELLALKHEKNKLNEMGRKDLAKKVRHISVIEGDGAGYDIESYNEKGEIKYIEVKTTKGNASIAFFMSSNEMEFSRQHSESYFLYRVYDYDESKDNGKMYVIKGNIESECELTPTQYRVHTI